MLRLGFVRRYGFYLHGIAPLPWLVWLVAGCRCSTVIGGWLGLMRWPDICVDIDFELYVVVLQSWLTRSNPRRCGGATRIAKNEVRIQYHHQLDYASDAQPKQIVKMIIRVGRALLGNQLTC